MWTFNVVSQNYCDRTIRKDTNRPRKAGVAGRPIGEELTLTKLGRKWLEIGPIRRKTNLMSQQSVLKRAGSKFRFYNIWHSFILMQGINSVTPSGIKA